MKNFSEYKRLFLQEAEEILQELNKNLLLFEKDSKNEAVLSTIFRHIHTLKGMAGSMNFQSIANLSHKMEDVFDQLKKGKISQRDEVVDLLFTSLDHLELLIREVEEKNEELSDITSLLSALDNLVLKSEKIE